MNHSLFLFIVFNIFKGFTLHSDKGYCLSKEGKSLAGCKASDIESRNDCGVACNILESCIAINYNIEFQNCLLITTSKPDNGCPTGFTWLNRVFAKSVDDLKVWPQANTVCYAKIQGWWKRKSLDKIQRATKLFSF